MLKNKRRPVAWAAKKFVFEKLNRQQYIKREKSSFLKSVWLSIQTAVLASPRLATTTSLSLDRKTVI